MIYLQVFSFLPNNRKEKVQRLLIRATQRVEGIYWFSSKKLIFITVKRKFALININDFIGQLIIYIFVDITFLRSSTIEIEKNFI